MPDPFLHKSTETNRGYTSHEMLDEMGLVHMNGRVYDSEIGRFLSADPNIQAPENSQNYNRYAYVLNNPLSYTDPSGYFFKKIGKWFKKVFKKVANVFKKIGKWIKKEWRTIVMIAFAFVAVFAFVALPGMVASIGGVSSGSLFGLAGGGIAGGVGGAVAGAALAGAATGAFNAALNGGDFGDILKGAAIGALQGAATAGLGQLGGAVSAMSPLTKAAMVVGHGVIGGVSNVAMGGKFKDGFISAAVSKLASINGFNDKVANTFNASGAGAVIARTLAAGVVGGTASALTGGKFANGAWTSAFQHLLNGEMTREKKRVIIARMSNAKALSKDTLNRLQVADSEIKAFSANNSSNNSEYLGVKVFYDYKSVGEYATKNGITDVVLFTHGFYDERTKTYVVSVVDGGGSRSPNYLQASMPNTRIHYATCCNFYSPNPVVQPGRGRISQFFMVHHLQESTMNILGYPNFKSKYEFQKVGEKWSEQRFKNQQSYP